MRKRTTPVLLIFLLTWAQADDGLAWTLAPVFPSAPSLADEDDEYLLVEAQAVRKPSTARTRLVSGDLIPETDDLSLSPGRRTPPGLNCAEPFRPSPLYVLMSLQR
jgi:hypothetical protein